MEASAYDTTVGFPTMESLGQYSTSLTPGMTRPSAAFVIDFSGLYSRTYQRCSPASRVRSSYSPAYGKSLLIFTTPCSLNDGKEDRSTYPFSPVAFSRLSARVSSTLMFIFGSSSSSGISFPKTLFFSVNVPFFSKGSFPETVQELIAPMHTAVAANPIIFFIRY